MCIVEYAILFALKLDERKWNIKGDKKNKNYKQYIL